MREQYNKHVWVATPGGRDGQGGIVRQMRYVFEAWPDQSDWKLHWLQTWHHERCKSCVYVKALMQFIRARFSGKADLLHLNLASHGSFYRKYLLARIARFLRVPFMVHLHGGGFREFYDESPRRQRARIEWLFYHAYQCVVLGMAWQHFLELCFRMPYEKITVIPNAVPDVAPVAKSHDVPHILFVGHVLPRKGMDELMLALAGLENLQWNASIIGSGEVERYRDEALRHGLQNRVRFTGWLDAQAVERHYAKADILVLPSHVENQPLCVLEAMARGVVVLATRVGTLPDMIEDGESGLLVPAGNAVELAKALAQLIEDTTLRARLASNARQQFVQRYTLAQHVQKMQAVYQECLSW